MINRLTKYIIHLDGYIVNTFYENCIKRRKGRGEPTADSVLSRIVAAQRKCYTDTMENEKKNGKRYTIQDIADAVGVTKATVSYVLNDKPGARVSEQTRSRILHVANLYNYAPNLRAKYLSAPLDNPVGLVFGGGQPWMETDYSPLIHALVRQLNAAGRQVMLFHADDLGQAEVGYPVDALVAVNLTETTIRSLSGRLFVPFILVDAFTDDSLFYAFSHDMEALRERIQAAHPGRQIVLICGPYENALYRRYLAGGLEEDFLCFYETPEQLRGFLADRVRRGFLPVYVGAAGALLAAKWGVSPQACVVADETQLPVFPETWRVYATSARKMARSVVGLLQDLTARREDSYPPTHRLFIPPAIL